MTVEMKDLRTHARRPAARSGGSDRRLAESGLRWTVAFVLVIVFVPTCLASLSDTGSTTTDSAVVSFSTSSVIASTEVIDSVGNVGGYSSVAVDSNDNTHICYTNSTYILDGDLMNGAEAPGLKYATDESGSWVTSTIDGGANVTHTSLAVDSNDRMHISYESDENLKYATDASGSWTTTVIDILSNWDGYTSLAVDSNDKIHISYESNDSLKYATDASGSWVTRTIDNDGLVGYWTSIAVDSNDRIHISYTGIDLKYATDASGSWVTRTIDASSFFEHTSIAVDSNDAIHIAYFDDVNWDLKYATDASGSWVTSPVDGAGFAGFFPSIAVDSENKVHMSYGFQDYSYGALKYATDASGSWTTFIIDTGGPVGEYGWVGEYTSIAVDSDDGVHISYYDYQNYDLRYAVIESTSPTASFTVSPLTGYTNTAFSVDASSSSDKEDVLSALEVRWDWESDGVWDTSWSSEKTDTHQYLAEGTHTITLEVRDTSGLADNTTRQVSVATDDVPPVADAGPDQNVRAGAIVTFDGSGSSDNVGIENFTWNFTLVDGAKELFGVGPTFGFDVPGAYTVTLTVEDAEGGKDTDTMTVTVEEAEEADEDDDRQKSFMESYGPVLGVFVASAVVALALFLVLRGRRGGKAPTTYEKSPS